ncbi:Pre-mRNA-processing factor 39 [Phytophthora cinnamomi]|uniref:Pre-mRNA-processing factor 39 n=1 Tax=Phytophthora cinnamomi TaxID=4785 RepID=UPI00355A557D|nr:Pre-mRNA-processing factor 39 [Phytophthora cinnamomi]
METPAALPTAADAANGSSADASGSNPIVLTVKTPLERLTEAVDKNPLDFNSWVSLLALVQSESGTPRETVEATYDRFLAEFPLCFGYWNKYAQYEYGLSNKTVEDGVATVATLDESKAKAREVYERGVVAVKYSVDMWMKYCEFLVHTLHSPIDETRPVLERAVEACGADPLAGPLWELYIQVETVNNDMPRLNQVFKRIMHQPLRNLEEFWEKYNQFVLAQQLNALATSEEQKALAGDGEEMMDEGLLRVKIVNAVEAVKNKTMEDIYRRQAFEAGIDRSYFHVTPVTEAAMKNWHSYLDFEEAAGNNVRYAVFQRAVTIFLKYRASIYLEYAAFLEAYDKLQKAQDTYMKVLSDVAPKLAEAFLQYCNFERRRGDVETAKTWYERGMEAVENDSDVYAYVSIAYATFLHKNVGDVALARSVLERAVQKRSGSVLLWMNFIHFEINVGGDNAELVPRVARVYDLALEDSCNITMDEKNDLWFQYVEFMENYASSVAKVREVRKKEMSWKLKHGQSRNRTIKVLTFQPGWDNDMGGYNSSVDPGKKRARYTAPQTSAVLSTPTAATSTTTEAAAATMTATTTAAPYYQDYQLLRTCCDEMRGAEGRRLTGATLHSFFSAGYGAQAQAYSQADPAAAATQQGYSQAQYASYYQQ